MSRTISSKENHTRGTTLRLEAFIALLGFALAAVWLAAPRAYATESLPYKPWPYGTPAEEIDALPSFQPDPENDIAEFNKSRVGVYLDLDKDGIPELIISQYGSIYCGTAGCSGEIHKKVGGRGKLLQGFSTPPERLYYSDELVGEYRTLYGRDRIFIWNGNACFAVCLHNWCRH
ncbi:MAG: hypothetical protein H8E30_11060 [Alphaproteobacteria bacterium]|nr:hypothetical protein [Alphaproteobacteria bacterium]